MCNYHLTIYKVFDLGSGPLHSLFFYEFHVGERGGVLQKVFMRACEMRYVTHNMEGMDGGNLQQSFSIIEKLHP